MINRAWFASKYITVISMSYGIARGQMAHDPSVFPTRERAESPSNSDDRSSISRARAMLASIGIRHRAPSALPTSLRPWSRARPAPRAGQMRAAADAGQITRQPLSNSERQTKYPRENRRAVGRRSHCAPCPGNQGMAPRPPRRRRDQFHESSRGTALIVMVQRLGGAELGDDLPLVKPLGAPLLKARIT